jgi:hypothetical protein
MIAVVDSGGGHFCLFGVGPSLGGDACLEFSPRGLLANPLGLLSLGA